MKLYLIRHGETEWNREGVFRGRRDIPLNSRGMEQADRMGKYLAGRKIALVRSSPLSRAKATAEAVAQAIGAQVETDERLTDINYGEWEGKALAEILASDAAMYKLWKKEPHFVTFPGGESLSCVRDRAMPAVLELCGGDRDAAIVSHRVVCKVAICCLLGLGLDAFWRIHVATAACTVFESDGREHRLLAHNIRPGEGGEEERDF